MLPVLYVGGALAMVFLIGASMSVHEEGETLSWWRAAVCVLLWPLTILLIAGWMAAGGVKKK